MAAWDRSASDPRLKFTNPDRTVNGDGNYYSWAMAAPLPSTGHVDIGTRIDELPSRTGFVFMGFRSKAQPGRCWGWRASHEQGIFCPSGTVTITPWKKGSIMRVHLDIDSAEAVFNLDGHSLGSLQEIRASDLCPCALVTGSASQLTLLELTVNSGAEETDCVAKTCETLWAARQYTDARVVCGAREIQVHRCVLAAASPFFARAFDTPMREGVQASITIEDADPVAVEGLLKYLYTGVRDDCIDAVSMLSLTHRLEVQGLVDHCAAELARGITAENVVSVVAALRTYRERGTVKMHWESVAKAVQADGELVRKVLADL